jgi:Transglycosylase SLT domain
MAGYAFEYESYPTVTPTGAPGNDFENIHATEGAFGARKARALEDVGQGAQQLGDTQLNMDSQAHAAEVHSWQSDQHNDAQSEYTALKGKAALDGLPAYHQKLQDQYQQAVDQASNPATKLMVMTEGRRLLDNFKEIGTRHADSQRDDYYRTTAIGAQESALDRAATYAQNGQYDNMDRALWTAGQEVQNQFDPPTRGPLDERERAAVDEQIKRTYGKGIYNIVDTFAKQGRFSAAEAIVKKYDEAGKIDADSRLRITAALEAHRAQRDGTDLAQSKIAEARGGKFAPSTNSAIGSVATRYGISSTDLSRAVQIESGGNPRAQTGSYKGLLQLSQSEFDKFKPRADASIWNPVDNLEAGAAKMKAEGDQFARNFGRQPSGFDSYMIHQQGLAGYSTHLANPDGPAWQNMLSTGEGRQKGDRWARAAIWAISRISTRWRSATSTTSPRATSSTCGRRSTEEASLSLEVAAEFRAPMD